MKDHLTTEMGRVNFICTTVDIWSCNNKSFFGVTSHWIDLTTLERRSCALACQRITGRHTHDVIVAVLHAVHAEHRVVNKIVMTVTDNGANFVKAFKAFACDLQSCNDDNVASNVQGDSDNDDGDDDITFTDVDSVLVTCDDDDESDDSEFCLPPHQHCAAHTLNLVASSDTQDANKDASYKKISRATLGKCAAMWNKTSRSTACADVVREKLLTCFVVPNATRWNSFYDAVNKIREILEKHQMKLCNRFFLRLR